MKNVYEDVMRNWQPQQRNLYELVVDGLDDFFEGGILSIALKTIALPSYTTDKITVPYLNTEVYFAGKTVIGEFGAEFMDFCDQNTMKAIKEWYYTVWNPETHRAGLAADYKKDATLTIYPPPLETATPTSGGTTSTIRSWDIKGLWIQSMDLGSMSYDDSGQVMIPTTLIADKAYPVDGF